MAEIFTNDDTTTLAAPMLIGDTTLVVTSGFGFPPGGQFRIRIDNELMIVNAVSGVTWSVTRAAEPISGIQAAAAHAAGAGVAGVISAGSLGSIAGADGASFTQPTLGTWTVVDHAPIGATLTAGYGGKCLILQAGWTTLDNFGMALKPIPTPPYSCIFHLKTEMAGANYAEVGVLWYDSVHVYTKTCSNLSNSAFGMLIQAGVATDGTAHTASNYIFMVTCRVGGWFKLADDGVNQTYSVSADGVTWLLLYSQARNTDVTPDHVGFFVNPRNTAHIAAVAALWSYQETSP